MRSPAIEDLGKTVLGIQEEVQEVSGEEPGYAGGKTTEVPRPPVSRDPGNFYENLIKILPKCTKKI
ncbi:MAG: hypothetical protein V1862_04730 [Methanobacteriota archaeon]